MSRHFIIFIIKKNLLPIIKLPSFDYIPISSNERSFLKLRK